MIIRHLFPEPLYFSKLERVLTKKELKTISQYKKEPAPNAGNMTSSENYLHPNSLVSGIFYVSADKKVDSITFSKVPLDERIKLNITKYNIFNSSSCTFPVETGNILLFRSSLEHGVKNKKGNNIRISLSFNIFIKGTVGNKEDLTELILE